jgi:Brp/Blh family beta-carotene 15,15'-monooxygenase
MPTRLTQSIPWILALAAVSLSLISPHGSASLAPWIFLSSAILIGVPHGACDPWIPGWVLHRPSRLPFLLIFFITYLALSALYLFLWRAYPLPSTIFFLFLTAWHWGSADASFEFYPGFRWLCFAIARGFLVMLSPFAFHLAEAWNVVLLMAPEAGPLPSAFLFSFGVFFSLILQGISRPAWKSWTETLLLLCLFYFAPPLLSVGIYFMAFHSWRHLLRLASIRDQFSSAEITAPWIESVFRLLLLSCPLTLATLIFLPSIPALVQTSTNQNWVGPYLVLLAVLTLPHAILVGWVDKKAPFVKP